MTAKQQKGTKARGRSAGTVGALGALVVAGAVLAAGASAPGDDTDNPSDGRVLPGKVSVLGDAKVRRWTGQTFSLEIPLDWAPITEDRSKGVYAWALPARGSSLEDRDVVQAAADIDWTRASRATSARVRVERVAKAPTAKASATKLSTLNADYANRFNDLGSVTIGERFTWRLELAAAQRTVESHYFFSTCNGATRQETWHLTVNRSRLGGRAAGEQRAAIERILESFRTVYPATPRGEKECTGSSS